MSAHRIIHAEAHEALASLADASVDSIVTDPPYELGFMGRGWDSTGVAYDVDLWRECLRVLKPGGHLLSFGGSRTWHRMAVAVEDAGFEIRDSIAWLYGSGMPKTPHVLKPAFEPLVVAPKPFRGSLVANVAAHGTGALNIAATRVEVADEDYALNHSGDRGHAGTRESGGATNIHTGGGSASELGRWPTNVILDGSQADALDEQSGVLKSGAWTGKRNAPKFGTTYGEFVGDASRETPRPASQGGASRFFPTFRYQAKAPKSERPVVDGVAHPTVKPLGVVRWLVKLVTPAGGVVLDVFAGSGTTAEAALLEGLNSVVVERGVEFVPLIQERLARSGAIESAPGVWATERVQVSA